MSDLNKVMIIGRLGKAPELSYTPSGTANAKFSVATKSHWNDKDGAPQEKTAWHNIVVWGKRAEVCNQYLTKGSQVYIEGRIDYREYEKDGVKKYFTDIIATNVQFIGAKGDETTDEPSYDAQADFDKTFGIKTDVAFTTDDIPF